MNRIFLIFSVFFLISSNLLFADNQVFFDTLKNEDHNREFVNLQEAKEIYESNTSTEHKFLYITAADLDSLSEDFFISINHFIDINKIAIFMHDYEIAQYGNVLSTLIDNYGPQHVFFDPEQPNKPRINLRRIQIILNVTKNNLIDDNHLIDFSRIHFNEFARKIFFLKLINGDNSAKGIGNNFFSDPNDATYDKYPLVFLDLRSLSDITEIGDNFLFMCGNLRSILFDPRSKIIKIGDSFLSACRQLIRCNLNFPTLECIGDFFMNDCENLHYLNLKLPNLRNVGDYALCGQPNLVFFDFSDNLNQVMQRSHKGGFKNWASGYAETIVRQYIQTGEENAAFQNLVLNKWVHLESSRKELILDHLSTIFDQEHPRFQNLIYFMSKDAKNSSVFNIHNRLIQKIKLPFTHNKSFISVQFSVQEKPQEIHFALSPACFEYQQICDKPLSGLEDVDAILEGVADNDIETMRKSPGFTSYFSSPFSKQKMMLQAIIGKYSKMKKERAQEHLVGFMKRLMLCGQGQNEEIQRQYDIESEPIRMASLKTITDVIISQKSELDKNRFLAMCSTKHPFGHCFRLIDDERSKRLRALFGKFSEDHELISFFLDKLNRIESFDQILNSLLDEYEILMPANIHGIDFSHDMLQNFVNTIKEKDLIEGKTIEDVKKAILLFLQNPQVKDMLDDWKSEAGYQLRALLQGFLRNKWPIGLFNLAVLFQESGQLSSAISLTFQNTILDKDLAAHFSNLRDVILEQFQKMKLEAVRQVAVSFLGNDAISDPHQLCYIKNLLGEAIGLRDKGVLPIFDPHLKDEPIHKGLQDVLDEFHRQVTPQTIINRLNESCKNELISIVDSSGMNIFWKIICVSAKESLNQMGFCDDEIDQNHLLCDQDGNVSDLAWALTLTKLDLFEKMNQE